SPACKIWFKLRMKSIGVHLARVLRITADIGPFEQHVEVSTQGLSNLGFISRTLYPLVSDDLSWFDKIPLLLDEGTQHFYYVAYNLTAPVAGTGCWASRFEEIV